MAGRKKKTELKPRESIQLDHIKVFFRRPVLKSILKILTMESNQYRTWKSLKSINKLFSNLDESRYKNSPESLDFIWAITYLSKKWLDGYTSLDIILEGAKRQPEWDPSKEQIINSCASDTAIIPPKEARTILELVGEALRYGYIVSMKDEYIDLLESIDLDDPQAFRELTDRLFLISQSLMDIKHNTNVVTNKVEFNTGDLDSVRAGISETIESLSESNSILKIGIKRWNTLLSPGYMNGRMYVYLGTPGSGKAQPVDIQIPTPQGWRRFGDLKVGDEVFSITGTPTKVTHIFPQGVQDTYRVTMSDGRSTLCNLDHLWEVWVPSHGILMRKVLPLRDMIDNYLYQYPGDRDRQHHRYRVELNKPVQYPAKEIPLDPWVLGYVIGNGCCLEGAFKISAPDAWAPNKIAKKLGYFCEKDHISNYSYIFRTEPGCRSRISTKAILEEIPEVYQKYSHEKRIPRMYLENTEAVRWELLRGLMDSDGSISKSAKQLPIRYDLSYSTSSPGLRDDVCELLYSLGISCKWDADIRAGKRTSFNIRIILPNHLAYRLFSYPKKIAIAEEAMDYTKMRHYEYVFITNIEKVEPTEQQCILIEDARHVYLTEHFIATHNSCVLLKTALDIRKYNPGFHANSPNKQCVLYITMENSFTETIERIWLMCFDDPITNYTEEEAFDKLAEVLGIKKILKDDVVAYDVEKPDTPLEAQLLADESDQDPNIELVIQYYPYKSIDTDDLWTIIQDLNDEHYDVCALVFDYIKRIEPAVPVKDNLRLELDHIMNELKALAVMKNIPVITAHQMNRASATVIDTAVRQGKADVAKLAGRDGVGDSWSVMEVADWVGILNAEYKPGTSEKYETLNVVKRRRIDSKDQDFAQFTYLAHPFVRGNGLRLIDDLYLDKVLSLKSLVSDIDQVGKEKINAAPRLRLMEDSDFVED